MAKPIAKGFCNDCNTEFIIWKATTLIVMMHELPNLPTVTCQCPICGEQITHSISFKEATIFGSKGVIVKHSYDDKTDLQPITEAEINTYLENPEKVISKLIPNE